MSEVTTPKERIDDVDITDEMQSSFLEYAYSVIYSRALPDARDGLKPVQRRILFQMNEMGLRPDKGHVKSARVVGEVMGKLHPHGDSSIYDALVRLAQDFTLRLPLVDGHGNFGSLDDGPAAARYTEARLAASSLAMNESIDEDVVDFVPNYDGQIMQPEVLPAAIPNLLVNGASGIAVGMATNLAPHNLIEVVEAAIYLLEHPDATVDQLMKLVPGPDLPGGGIIMGLDGIRDAYETGKGAFKTRAKVSIEQISARKSGIVVTELPFLIGPERIIEKIKQGVDSKKLSGISDVTDLSDRKNGLRMVISVKNGFNPAAVLEQLYRHTPLEDSFSINNVALVDGQPQTLSLKQMLEVFLVHRLSVVTRRSQFRLSKRTQRLHLVDGLLIAILDIDEVIQLIRTSDDSDAARTRLCEVFDLSEQQAEYILELRLRRLTKFSRVELEAERDQLRSEIAELEAILASEDKRREILTTELREVSAAHGTPRRTVLSSDTAPVQHLDSTAAESQLQVADSPCEVLLSVSGLILRTEPNEGASVASPKAKRHGAMVSSITTTTHSELIAVLSDGTARKFTAADLPQVPSASISFSAGVPITGYLGLPKSAVRVVNILPVSAGIAAGLVTRNGVVKRLKLDDVPSKPEFEIISLKSDDSLIAAFIAPEDSELTIVTSDAQLLRFAASTVRPQGRSASGMAGIKLSQNAKVIFAGPVLPGEADLAVVVTVARGSAALPGTEMASGKVSPFGEFPAKGRATGGVRAHKFLKGEDELSCAWVGSRVPQALTADGKLCDLPAVMAKRDGSGSALESPPAFIGAQVG